MRECSVWAVVAAVSSGFLECLGGERLSQASGVIPRVGNVIQRPGQFGRVVVFQDLAEVFSDFFFAAEVVGHGLGSSNAVPLARFVAAIQHHYMPFPARVLSVWPCS